MKITKKILFAGIILLLTLPLIQSRSGMVKEKKLEGFFRLKDKPTIWTFSIKSWLDNSFQDEFARRVEDHTGFRKTFIRIRNQYDYTLYGISHASGFIREKQGVLVEEDYIHEYTGKYFIGKRTIDRKLDRLKDVIQKLKEKNIDLVIVFEPGKASFYPEYIPDHYRPRNRTLSNYDYMVSGLQERNIPFLDLNRYFLMMKDTSRYPLFPKYGMHWSIYGMWFAVDTLTRYIEHIHSAILPQIKILRTELSDSLRGSDNDIGFLLNLIFPLPQTPAAYPITEVGNSPDKRKLSVLVVADSYYVNIEQTLSDKLFGKEEFWYYNSKVYPYVNDDDHPVYIDKSDLPAKLREFDVILLMTSEINLHCMFWNFIDESYLAINPGTAEDPVYTYENKIRNYRDWFRFVVAKARRQQRSVEKMIRLDAEYMYELEGKK
jgi:hypothetical protein